MEKNGGKSTKNSEKSTKSDLKSTKSGLKINEKLELISSTTQKINEKLELIPSTIQKINEKLELISDIIMILHKKKDRFSLKNRPFKSNTSDISPEIPLNYILKFLYIINKSMRISQEFSPKQLLL